MRRGRTAASRQGEAPGQDRPGWRGVEGVRRVRLRIQPAENTEDPDVSLTPPSDTHRGRNVGSMTLDAGGRDLTCQPPVWYPRVVPVDRR